jgi:uroporphyrinogen-III synthase
MALASTHLRIVAFEARRADELATLLSRHDADVLSAPALREAPLAPGPEVETLATRLAERSLDAVILLTGVGTRLLAATLSELRTDGATLLSTLPLIARGPKPLAALRALGISGAHTVPGPFTWREVLPVVDAVGLVAGSRVAVQEYGIPNTGLLTGLAARGLDVLRVPVYRWALPADRGPLEAGAQALTADAVDVAVFTNAAQVEHLFTVAPDADRLRSALARTVVASVGPVCSEALEAHGVTVDLEASPPKMGPLVALIAENARAILAAKRARC